MKIFNSIQDFRSPKKTIVTIGTFDGVHIGHKKIIEKLIQNVSGGAFESLILTFFPHPRMVLSGKSAVKLLNTLDEKKALLEKTGLDNLIIHPFDETFSMLSAEEFVRTILVERLNVHKIIIGHDHRFGKNRAAGIDDLIGFGRKYGFVVEQIPVQEIHAVTVSSTKIRAAIENAQMELANSYLGYDYPLTGEIAKGKQLGRTIGFPTANLKISEDYKLIPKIGVYLVKSNLDGKVVFGMMNIGTNPTVDGKNVSIETYFFDFGGDLYGKPVRLAVLHFMREEQKFASVEQLKNQLQADQKAAIALLAKGF